MKHIPADLNTDETIDILDLMYLTDRWLWTGDPGYITEDIIEDGKIDLKDFEVIGKNWDPN